jgi:hypothetical protein
MPIGQEAVELLRKALSIAEEQGAKLWELPATTSLAGSAATKAVTPKPATFLAPVYGWFTEGLRHARSEGGKGAA